MSLVEAVRFRSLASKLSDNEKHELILKLLSPDNDVLDDVIFRSLFSHFSHASRRRQGTAEAQRVNQMMAEIMEKRNNKVNKAKITKEQTIAVGLDRFAKELIGSIGSFLDQTSYHRLGLCNRLMYTACCTHNQLQSLSLKEDIDLQFIDLSLYPSLKYLLIDENAIMGPLTLTSHPKVLALDMGDNTQNFIEFSSKHHEQFTNVQELNLRYLGTTHVQALQKLLRCLPALQFLALRECNANFGNNVITAVLPRLKGLHLGDDIPLQLERGLLSFYGPYLQHVSLCDSPNIGSNISTVDLGRLKEFRGQSLTINTLNEIISKSAEHLTQISIDFDTEVKPKAVRDIIFRLVTSCKKLTEFQCHDGYDNLVLEYLDGLADGLFRTKSLERSSFNVLITDYRPSDNIPNCSLHMWKIIHLLSLAQIDDWMLIWKTRKCADSVNQLVLDDLKQMAASIVVRCHQSSDDQVFVIQNENCKLNGYKTSWMMHEEF